MWGYFGSTFVEKCGALLGPFHSCVVLGYVVGGEFSVGLCSVDVVFCFVLRGEGSMGL